MRKASDRDLVSIHLQSIFFFMRLLALLSLLFITACSQSPWPKSDHFDGEKFHNPESWGDSSRAIFWWLLTRDQPEWPDSVSNTLPRAADPSPLSADSLRVTFVNHATVLLQGQGWAILTDPVWSERVSPVTWAGPQRKRAPGLALDSLPALNAILISHNHYDHLDRATLKRLREQGDVPVFTPLGAGELIRDAGFTKVTEMDWWQDTALQDSLRIICIPARHGTGRGLFDRNETLWAGFVIVSPQGRILFLGDTGYGPHLTAIGDSLGPFRASLIPIGAYTPRRVMRDVHMDPWDAVRAAKETRSNWWLPIHWGTFPLADDSLDQPLHDLDKALRDDTLTTRPTVLRNGQSRLVP